MFSGLLNIMYTGFPGGPADLAFLYEDGWLLHTVVNTRIVPVNGSWQIYLVFASTTHYCRLLARSIGTAATEKKAAAMAAAWQRMANRGSGTLKLHYDDYNICPN